MAKYKLDELCEFITDGTHQTPEYCEEGGVIFLSSKDVTERKINWDDVKYIPESLHQKLYKRLSPKLNDILLAKNGTTGVAAIVDRDEVFDVYVSLAVLRPLESVYPKYLLYAINSPVAKRQFNAGLKGIGVPNLHLGVIRETVVNVAPRDEQEKICEILDKVSSVIDSRKAELSALDDLIKARFVEMFGSPFDTTKWTVKELKDVSESMVDGSNVNPDYYEAEREVLFLRIQNVWRNEFRLDDSVYITQEINHKYYYDTSLRTGDLLITKIGRYYTKDSSLGRVSVYRGEDDCANYSNNIMRVRLSNSMNSEFVNALLNLDDYQSFIKRTSKGGTDKRALSKSLIGSYPIIIPPRALQDEFVAFVEQVDKSKVTVQKALDETQLLFDSLMQKYFG